MTTAHDPDDLLNLDNLRAAPFYTPQLPRTAGDYADEAASLAALDAVLDRCALFTVYKEVWGTSVQPRPCQEDKRLRVDRVLVPMRKLKEAGWSYGVIGIEAKRSDIKIGPAISQCLDYGRSLFELAGGVRVWLDWVFLWPLDKQHEALASVMAQNRVGTAQSNDWAALDLFVGEGRVLQVGHDGSIDVGRGVTYGKRAGSR